MRLPEPKYQNSAGRLLAILSVIPQGHSILTHVPNLFGTNGATKQENQQACLAGLAEIHHLHLQLLEDMSVAEIGDAQRQVILSGLTGIRDAIYPTNLEQGFRGLSDAEKSLLEVAATIIPFEETIQKDDIDLIRASIAELRALVEDASIPAAIRKILLDLIRMSEDAISRFNINGARGLRKAFKSMLAEAAEAYGLMGNTREREALQKSGAWAAIVKHLKTFDAVSSRLLKYRGLFQAASQLLLGAPSPDDGGGQASSKTGQ